MGFLDEFTDAVKRGSRAVGRGNESLQINGRLDYMKKKQKDLMSELGFSLYAMVKSVPDLAKGREAILDELAAVDEELLSLRRRLSELDNQAIKEKEELAAKRAAEAEARTKAEAEARARVAEERARAQSEAQVRAAADMQMRAQAAQAVAPMATVGLACPSCGAPITQDDNFCTICGFQLTKLDAETEQPATVSVCPDCGTAIGEGSKFCTACGRQFF